MKVAIPAMILSLLLTNSGPTNATDVSDGAGASRPSFPAGPPGPRHRSVHDRFDEDGDGTVSTEEVKRIRSSLFGVADGNNDTILSLEEFEQYWILAHRQSMVRAFQRADRDGDHQVTQEEFERITARLQRRIERRAERQSQRRMAEPRWRRKRTTFSQSQ